MANTYTQIHIQAVFAVQNRKCVINNSWKEELYKYITGIVQNYQHKLLAINGMPDHVHVLVGLRPSQSISDFVKEIKGSSSKWINQRKFIQGRFSWQEGYGAFSYGKSDLPKIVDYVLHQQGHHEKKTFMEEYIDMLHEFEIDYDERFIFKPVGVDYSVPDGTC